MVTFPRLIIGHKRERISTSGYICFNLISGEAKTLKKAQILMYIWEFIWMRIRPKKKLATTRYNIL